MAKLEKIELNKEEQEVYDMIDKKASELFMPEQHYPDLLKEGIHRAFLMASQIQREKDSKECAVKLNKLEIQIRKQLE